MPTFGEYLVQQLAAYGVDTIFGIPGVHTVELYRGLPATSIRHVTPRHEQGAGFMADGYARVSGRPGVCFIITGPGMTNIATAMGQAYADSIPMLVISSVNKLRDLGMGQGRLHELPGQRDLISGVAAFSHTVLHPEQLPEVLARAFAVFSSARPRPVHIEIPVDIIGGPAGDLVVETKPLPGRPGPAPDALVRAAEALQGARAPFVVLGGGAVDAGAAALRLIEALDAPFLNTVNAKGVIAPGHRLHAGENLGWEPLRAALRDADVVLAVGTEFGETEMYPEPHAITLDGTLIRIDLDPEQLVRAPAADIPIVSDARFALEALNDRIGSSTRAPGDGAARAAAVREAVQAAWWPAISGHKRVLDTVQSVLADVIVVGDQTQPVYGGNQFYEPTQPRSWFNSSTGYGTLGYGLPAAIGAKIASPDRPVIALIGDGGLQFTLPELASAVEAQVPVIVLVWNNDGYQEIETYMHEKDISPIGVRIHTPDFIAIARGFGCAADRATDLDHLASLLRAAATRTTPSLIEIHQDAAFLNA